jgi:hypothetical protein
MKVFGAGLSKTGTFSLKIALDKLGFPCYNFGDVLINHDKGHTDKWNNYMEGLSDMDWHKLFEDYDAVVDGPTYLFAQEMLDAFPDIKVIMTKRDPDKWYDSFMETIEKHNAKVNPVMFLPSFNGFQRSFKNIFRISVDSNLSREAMTAWFNRHNEEIPKLVPPDRLLAYNVQEGWEPLCEFLDVPVPDEEFPWINKNFAAGEKLLQGVLKRDLEKMVESCNQVLAMLEKNGS